MIYLDGIGLFQVGKAQVISHHREQPDLCHRSDMDGSLVLALISSGAAVLNGIGLLMTWMKYRKRAFESLIFAREVLGALHGGEEDYPPPDLAARVPLIIGKISS